MNTAPRPVELGSFFQHLALGAPLDAGPFFVVPLVGELQPASVTLLAEGVSAGVTRVGEVSSRGQVSSVRVEHAGSDPLLLLDGEQIVGAKQNRVFNASFLVAPHSSADVPVSCVERGRWSSAPGSFRSESTTLAPALRASKLHRVTQSLREHGHHDARQAEVWRDVDAYLERSQITSVTSAYEQARSAYPPPPVPLGALAQHPEQTGVALVSRDRLLSLDLFGSASLFRRALRTVASAFFADLYERAWARRDPRSVVAGALWRVTSAPVQAVPAPGFGETWFGRADGHSLCGVALGGRPVHVAVG